MDRGHLATALDLFCRTTKSAVTADLTDRQLLDLFGQHGDQAAFAALLHRHGPLVSGVCRRVLRQIEDAEDAFQATFLVLARKAGSGRWRESVGPWLHETARRIALRSKEMATRRRLLENQQVANCQTSTPANVACEELCGILDEELQRLPQAYKAPLVLCYLEGRSQDQAAHQLGWTLRTLQRRLEQARDRLRARLVRRGVTLSAALLAEALTEEPALAALSSRLTTVTTQAAMAFASGSEAAGISAPVQALAQSTLRALTLTQLKVGLSVVLVVAGLALAGGSAIQHALFSNHQEKKQENQSPPEIKKSGEKTAKEDNAATKDLFGNPLPKGALARLGSLRFRHTGYIYGVRYSPDGKVLATTDTLHLYFWKADTGELIRKDEGAIFRVIAFSEDGKMLAGADYDLGDKDCRTMRVCIWNAATGEEVHRFKKSVANGRWVQGVASPVAAFAPDNKSLASAWDDGTVRIWEIPTGKELLKLEVEASGLAFSPDGKKLAIIGGRELGLWDPGTGEEIQKFEGEQGTLVAFSRDGKMLASTDKRMARVKLWDPTTGNLLEQFNPEGLVDALTFSHDGKMLAAGGFGETAVRIWDLPNDKQMRKLKGVPRFVHSLDFAPDGKTLALGGQSLVLQRWDPRTGKQLDRKEEQDDYMLRLAFSPDNKILATAGLGQSVRLWDSVTGKALRKLEDLDAQSAEGVSPLAFTPDGKSLVGIGGLKKGASAETLDTIVLWNPAEGKVCHRFGVSGRVFNTAAFSPDGRALATAEHSITQHLNPFTHKDAWETGVVRLWNPVSGEQIWKVTLGQQISALAFSADGKMLAVGGGLQKCVRLLDANTGKETHSWQAEVPVTALAFFPQGEVLITSPDGMLRNVATGKKLRLLEYEKTDKDGFAWPRALSVSPDGRMLATRNGPRKIGMWEIASGRQRCSFTHFLQSMEFVAFSPDGKRLATTCDDGTALIWDVTGQGQPRRAVRLTPEALEILWSELESADAEKAYQALQTLAAVPEQTVGLLKERLSPSNSNVKQAVSLAADLDSNGFEARGNAREELAKLEGVAEPALRQDLKKNPSAKAEKTILDQLSQLDPGRSTSSYVIRTKRAIEVLEWLGTAEAKKLLQSLSERKPPDLCAQEAKAALNRLEAAP